MAEKKKIFISYAREDSDAANKLYTALRQQGFDPWLDEEDLLAGLDWRKTIRKAIKNTDYVAILISSVSVSKRGFVQVEQKRALEIAEEFPDFDIFVIPVRLNECEIPFSLENLHWVDLFPDYEKGLDKIIKALQAERKSDEKPPDILPVPPPPNIYVSYSVIDNDQQWVSTFVHHLESEIAKRMGSKDAFSVFTDRDATSAKPEIPSEIIQKIENSAILVAVVSPGYLNSARCSRERLTFLRKSGDVIIVERERIDENALPGELRAIRPYRFWVEDKEIKIPITFGHPVVNAEKDTEYFKLINYMSYALAKKIASAGSATGASTVSGVSGASAVSTVSTGSTAGVSASLDSQSLSPVTEQSRSPVTEQSRSPVTEQGRSPVTERGRRPVTEQGRSPVTERGRRPVTEQGRSPVTEQSRSPVTEQGRSQVTEQSRRPVTEQSRSPVTEQSRSPVTEQGRSPVTEQGRSPVTEQSRSPVTERGRSPVTEQGRSQVTERGRSPVTEQGRSPVTEQSRSQVTERGRSPVTEQGRSQVTERGRSPVTEQGRSPVTEQSRSPVFLAEVTDDLAAMREDVERYLTQAGFKVVPENPPEMNEAALLKAMEPCRVFVQLLSEFSGKSRGSAIGKCRLQFECARKAGKTILRWRSPDLNFDNADDDQKRLLSEPAVMPMEIGEFKKQAVKRADVRDLQTTAAPDVMVFINAEKQDKAHAEDVGRLMKNRGIGHVLPIWEGSEQELLQDMEAFILDSRGVVVVYGNVRVAWVRKQILYCRNLNYRRSEPLEVLGVYDAPAGNKQDLNFNLPGVLIINCRNCLDEDEFTPFFHALTKGGMS
ncbi:TIR domain-containing protein [Desulfococcaceae bacterium HSG8]|nr:TIR domain-containing protein [Desulfococcaceae bacterium HSG8]